MTPYKLRLLNKHSNDVCVCVFVCERDCVRERERERECVCVYVCVCLCVFMCANPAHFKIWLHAFTSNHQTFQSDGFVLSRKKILLVGLGFKVIISLV